MNKLLLLCIFSLCILFSCDKEDETEPITICDSSALWLNYEDCCYFALPNVFTPNNNGINDQFRLLKFSAGIDNPTVIISDYSLTVKQGETIVFESEELDIEWDGTYDSEVVSGLLEYTLSITNPENGEIEVFVGEVASLPNIAESGWNDEGEYYIENCETCIAENKFTPDGWTGDSNGEPEICE